MELLQSCALSPRYKIKPPVCVQFDDVCIYTVDSHCILVRFLQNICHVHSQINSPWCCIYASVNWVSISSGNGLSPVRHQASTWTNAGLLSIILLGTNFSEILIRILFSFKKMHLKLSSAKMAAISSRGRWVKLRSSLSYFIQHRWWLSARLQ